MLKKKTIEFSKKKVHLQIATAVLFILIGVTLLSLDANTIERFRRYNNTTFVYGIAITCILLSSLCVIYDVKFLLQKSQGLILNSTGIHDNTSTLSHGKIPWNKIKRIEEIKLKKQKIISIHVNNLKEYTKKGNFTTRMMKQIKIMLFKTPITITANNLKIDHQELYKLINQYYHHYRK